MASSENDPLSWKNLLAGIIVTVVGGIILAWIIRDAIFAPSPEETVISSTPNVPTPIQTLTQPPPNPTPTTQPPSTPTLTALSSVLFQEDFEGDLIKLQPRDRQYWRVETDEKRGNRYYCVSPPRQDYTYASTGSLTWENYILEVDVMIPESSTTGSGNILVRATGYSAYVYDFSEKETVLTKEGDFIPKGLDGPTVGLITSNWYSIRFEVRDSDISVALDGIQVCHAKDGDIERGGVSFGAGWGLNTCFDNVRVIALEPES